MSEKSTKSPNKRQQNEPMHYGDSKRTRENGHHLQSGDDVNPGPSNGMSSNAGPQHMGIYQNGDDVNPGPSNGMSSNAGPQHMEIDQEPTFANKMENIAEVVLEVNINILKNSDKKGMEDALRACLALRNSCGGIVILKHSKGNADDMDKWIQNFYNYVTSQRNNMGDQDAHWKICWNEHDGVDRIFVTKSSSILTEKSGLLQRSEKQNDKIRSYALIKSMLADRNSRSSTPCKCHNCDKSAVPQWECLQKESFIRKGLTESKSTEFKNFPDKDFREECSGLRDKVRDNVSAFSNANGGTLYIGIEDKTREVIGQLIESEKQVESKIRDYISKTKCIPYSSKQSKICAVNHFHIRFIPVVEDSRRKVIAVDICKFDGTVFLAEPECPIIDENNKVVNMPFEEWLLHFNVHALKVQQQDPRKKFGVYKEIKGTMFDDILQSLNTQGQVKIHPTHAQEWIRHEALDSLFHFMKEGMTSGGHLFVQRGWNALLGKPNLNPPSSTLCDVLVCSSDVPLLLVTLVDPQDVGNQAICSYNTKLAKTLKRVLAQDGGCTQEFLVKPLVITTEDLSSKPFTTIMSLPPCYPPQEYKMDTNKYPNILKSLAWLLTRVNSNLSVEAGLKHYATLTKEQYDILEEFYGSSSKVKITGLPGTGKTLLALERVMRLRMGDLVQWDEVLFVSSNKCLESRVENHPRLCHDGERLCEVINYFTLANNPCLVKEYKHIVLDEVHNYKERPSDTCNRWWWKSVIENEDCTYWFFLDESQRITKERTVMIPKGVTTRPLNTLVRTTASVYNFFKRYYPEDTPGVMLGHDVKGSFPEILIPKSQPLEESCKELNVLISKLHKLIVKDGYSPNDITVLFTDSTARKKYQHLFLRRTKHCPTKSGEENKKDGVIFETIRRYSGDDRPIVIGFCPKFDANFQNNMALMASLCSRPLLDLILIFDSLKTALSFHVKKDECKIYSPPKTQIYDFSSPSFSSW